MTSLPKIKPIQLDNKFGLTDCQHIAEAETLIMTLAAAEGMPKGSYDLEHLADIHRHAFGEMYSWAGSFVETDNESYTMLRDALSALANQDVSEMNSTSFGTSLADHYLILQAYNPFAHGGSRAIRLLIEEYAANHTMHIDWGMQSSASLRNALDIALNGDSSELHALFISMVTHQDLLLARNDSGVALRTAEIFQAAGLSEALVRFKSVINEKDASELMRNVSHAYQNALASAKNQISPLQHHWDRTSLASPQNDQPSLVQVNAADDGVNHADRHPRFRM